MSHLQLSGTGAEATSLPDQNQGRKINQQSVKNKRSKTGRRKEPVVLAEGRELGVAIKIGLAISYSTSYSDSSSKG